LPATEERKSVSNQTVRAAFDSAKNGKAFIPFVTCGDPDLETTAAIVRELEAAGASIIELGIPFSDPTAEGPVIQDANIRSLAAGTNTDKVFDLVKSLREGDAAAGIEPVRVPLLAMTYANVVFHYGTERFCENAAAAGLDGIILPDTSFEEKAEFAAPCEAAGLAYISLIAPTSEERIGMIASEAQGFIYLVSSLGVTGTRSAITTDLDSIVAKIRQVTDVPVAIGFGISGPEAAHNMAAKADGAIVGSAIVKLVAQHGTAAAPHVGQFAKSIVDAL
jgi:tryptophan synthase alpha chain